MKGEATEEDCEHKCPFKILEKRIEERTFADTVSHDGKCDVTETIEDDDDTEPHLPGVNIVLFQVTVEPAAQKGSHRLTCSLLLQFLSTKYNN